MSGDELQGLWESATRLNRPSGELAMSAYLAAPEPTPTGVEKLDQLLGGGLLRGVTVVGGPSSAGKSVLGCQCASRLSARGRKVIYASYEMSWEVVQLRCASAWSCYTNEVESFSWSSVVNGYEKRSRPEYANKTRQELSRYLVGSAADPITRALTAWDEGPGRNLAVLTEPFTVDELVETARALAKLRPILIVDYIQIVPTDKKDEQKEYERVSEVMNVLQAYAIGEGGGNVLAISSTKKLSAQEYKDGPTMDWYRGSGYIGFAAEQAVMLVPDKEKTDNGLVVSRNQDGSVNGHMTVVKNKSGASDVSVTTRLYGGSNLII